jgi:hypothetical protein
VIVTSGSSESQSAVPLKVAWRGEFKRIGYSYPTPNPIGPAIAAGARGPTNVATTTRDVTMTLLAMCSSLSEVRTEFDHALGPGGRWI